MTRRAQRAGPVMLVATVPRESPTYTSRRHSARFLTEAAPAAPPAPTMPQTASRRVRHLPPLLRCCLPGLLSLATALLMPAQAAPVPAATAPGAPQLLRVQNGLVQENEVALADGAQRLADTIGRATGRRTLWVAHDALGPALAAQPAAWAFVKPPSISAKLQAKGWQLVAVALPPHGFGTDFIAQPCPGHADSVLLGGPTLSTLGIAGSGLASCVAVRDVWNSPAAVLLAPAKGSLVDKVAAKMWLMHAPKLPPTVHVQYQNAVTDFMQVTHAAVIGVVTPLVSAQWRAHGGLVLAHQQMPFWTVLAAPGVPASQVAKVRAALMAPDAQPLDRALHVAGWEAGNPQVYADFLHWLKP